MFIIRIDGIEVDLIFLDVIEYGSSCDDNFFGLNAPL
jgi:hypothetical protein